MNRRYHTEEKILNYPNDISLPFFAYGIFKPGQLAYSKIKNHVKDINPAEINYEMKHRDGVPILIERENDFYRTQGTILTFREGQESETYHIIRKTLLRKLYKWKTISIDGEKVNALFGVNPEMGSNEIKNEKDRINFDGKKDPLFTTALELIEENLKSENDSNYNNLKSKTYAPDEFKFFTLQMNYMLLWSAIDRYTSLKYNQSDLKGNYEKFANQKAFKESIKKFKDMHHFPVYSTDDLEFHEFNADNPMGTFYYYYTFRCNVVHNGKTLKMDYPRLKMATEELLEIFKNVLKNTFEI